jgi:hypothetical protein
MPTMNFPSAPSVGDIHTVGPRKWRWDGTVWATVASSVDAISQVDAGTNLTGGGNSKVITINLDENVNVTTLTADTISVDSQFTLPGTDGANSQTLVTDGAGNVSWASLSSDSLDGSSLFYATGTPLDSVGSEGDFYLDTSNAKLYGPKGSTSWLAEDLALVPKRFVFTQAVASSSWAITHDLDGFPSVSIVDSAGSHVVGDVEYNSTSSITVNFESSFAGTAYLT